MITQEQLSKAFAWFGVDVEINANGRVLVTHHDPDCSEWFFLSSVDGKEYDYSGFSGKEAAEFAKKIQNLE